MVACQIACFLQATDGAESVPISFRYEVSFPDSGKTHMFKPNPLEKEAAKHVSFGAAYASLGYDKIESNTRMQVVCGQTVELTVFGRSWQWPRQVETRMSPPQIMMKKPKCWLTCKLRMEPRSWCKLFG